METKDKDELEILHDHENRIRKLEESDIRQQIQLANIEKSQSDIKLMINENTKEQRKTLNDFTAKILDTFTNNIRNDNIINNDIKFYKTKEFWTIMGLIVTAILGYFFGQA